MLKSSAMPPPAPVSQNSLITPTPVALFIPATPTNTRPVSPITTANRSRATRRLVSVVRRTGVPGVGTAIFPNDRACMTSSRREAILNYLQEDRARAESLTVLVAERIDLLELPTTSAAFEMLLIAVACPGLQVRPN